MSIRNKGSKPIQLAAPRKFTGMYESDFENTLDESALEQVSVTASLTPFWNLRSLKIFNFFCLFILLWWAPCKVPFG